MGVMECLYKVSFIVNINNIFTALDECLCIESK